MQSMSLLDQSYDEPTTNSGTLRFSPRQRTASSEQSPERRALLVISPQNWRLTRFTDLLQSLGYQCTVETSPEGARFSGRNHSYDLLVVDRAIRSKHMLLKSIQNNRQKMTAMLILTAKQSLSDGKPVAPFVHPELSPQEVANSIESTKSLLVGKKATSRPETIGDYKVMGELGRGGMGIVYKAKASDPDAKPVAVKILKAKQRTERGFKRFLREANILAELSHPNLVKVHEVGTQDQSVYFVMDIIAGRSLDKFKGPWPNKRAAVILYKVAKALEYIHARGVLHRDIKPGNILVDRNMAVTLTDFGLARRDTDLKMTATNTVVGTVRYIAPEVMIGEGHDERSDLFSLGIVALEMLTGKRAFTTKSTYEIMRILVDGKLRRACDDPNIDPDLASIVDKLLETNPDNRFSSATELRVYLQTWLKVQTGMNP